MGRVILKLFRILMQPYLHKANKSNNNNNGQPPDNWLARKLMFFCSQYAYSRVHTHMYTCDVHTYISIPVCTYVCVCGCVCTRVVVVGANCCVVWQTLREHSNSNAANEVQFSSVKMLQKIHFRKNVRLKKYKVCTHTHTYNYLCSTQTQTQTWKHAYCRFCLHFKGSFPKFNEMLHYYSVAQ